MTRCEDTKLVEVVEVVEEEVPWVAAELLLKLDAAVGVDWEGAKLPSGLWLPWEAGEAWWQGKYDVLLPCPG